MSFCLHNFSGSAMWNLCQDSLTHWYRPKISRWKYRTLFFLEKGLTECLEIFLPEIDKVCPCLLAFDICSRRRCWLLPWQWACDHYIAHDRIYRECGTFSTAKGQNLSLSILPPMQSSGICNFANLSRSRSHYWNLSSKPFFELKASALLSTFLSRYGQPLLFASKWISNSVLSWKHDK